jgi:hypothetical protein
MVSVYMRPKPCPLIGRDNDLRAKERVHMTRNNLMDSLQFALIRSTLGSSITVVCWFAGLVQQTLMKIVVFNGF